MSRGGRGAEPDLHERRFVAGGHGGVGALAGETLGSRRGNPLRCCLLLTPEAAILSLIVHRVIDMTASRGVAQRLASFVQGKAWHPGIRRGIRGAGATRDRTGCRGGTPEQNETAMNGDRILDLLLEAFRQALDSRR
ncbi:hypothetical protein DSL92_07725 [Billgrantia gudaonensis]|uniref:Uncharacterized protein n=1 Tax=Billgrantia gudaonensis TaxID=376427 RepID=A0A432JI54_9GAMM|nr:hypothetical protein DSL92_07725 [Halomonas gudaonensis]